MPKNSADYRLLMGKALHPRRRRVFHGVAAGDGNGLFGLVLPQVSPGRLLSGRRPIDAKEPQNDFKCGAEYAFACTMISLWEGARA